MTATDFYKAAKARRKRLKAAIRQRWAAFLDEAKIPYSVCPNSGGGQLFIHTDPHIIAFPVTGKWKWRDENPETKAVRWHEGNGLYEMLQFIDEQTNLFELQVQQASLNDNSGDCNHGN
jgi:hypothetical protein